MTVPPHAKVSKEHEPHYGRIEIPACSGRVRKYHPVCPAVAAAGGEGGTGP